MSTPQALVSLLVSSALAAQCLPTPGNAIPIAQDSISGPHAIGFAFPIFGTTYSDIHVSDHGICFLSNGATPPVPAASPLVHTPASPTLVANGPVICPFWSDTVPGAAGQFYIDAQSTQCTITWANVQSFGIATPLMTFQLRLFANGNLEFVYDPQVTNDSTWPTPSDNAVVGVSPGAPMALPASSDLSANLTTADYTVYEHFLTARTFDVAADSLLFQPQNPGWQVSFIKDGSECAYVESYGAGCHNLELTSTPPVLGSVWTLTTTGLEPVAQVGFTMFCFERQIPPIPLTSYGINAPGCFIHPNPNKLVTRIIATNNNGTCVATANIPITAWWLIGESWTNQTFAFSTMNPAGVASSNGVHCTQGY